MKISNCFMQRYVRSRTALMFLLITMIIIQLSCKKLVDTPPATEFVTETNVFSIDAGATAVLNGIYISMNGNTQPFQGNRSITLYTGLSADELMPYNGINSSLYLSYYQNVLTSAINSSNAVGSELWAPLYNYIFRCNAAIEGLSSWMSDGLTPLIKQQLLGEATFMRAFFYFYLLNLFGDVPLALTTDPEVNTNLTRASQAEVFQQVISDLEKAEEGLSDSYLSETLLSTTIERVRPTKWAAKALLARVYLYVGDWRKAEMKASEIISNDTLFDLPSLNNVFLKNSREAIWQLQPTAITFNTQEAQTLVVPQVGPNSVNNPVLLSKYLFNSFETGDQRAVLGNWIDTTIYKLTGALNDTVIYPNKYKLNVLDPTITTATGTDNMREYFMVLRLGEQYLIRAEARAQQGNLSEAQNDVNAIRKRAFLTPKPLTTNDKASLLAAILHERQVELFCEWGHRWLDLKRTGNVDEVMRIITPLKSNGAPWQSYQQLYPLPYVSDLQRAPNLVQNEGYPARMAVNGEYK